MTPAIASVGTPPPFPTDAISRDHPPLGGHVYTGKTSAGFNVSLRVSKSRRAFVPQSRVHYDLCGTTSFQRLNPDEKSPGLPISRTGSFSGTLLRSINPEKSGTRVFSGRFGRGGTTVTGSFRIVLPDGCDSGVVTFKASTKP